MGNLLGQLWRTGVVGTFLTGLFFVLPVVLTVAIMGWVISKLEGVLGPGTWLGELLSLGGSTIAGPNHATISFWLGILLALGGIWLIGFLVRTRARLVLDRALSGILERLPLVRSIYGPVSQVVGLLRGDSAEDVKGMEVVLCRFGKDTGASVLALLTSRTVYPLNAGDSYLIYLPTSPLPMSGGLTFVPAGSVTPVPEVDVDGLMRIYFSLGALSPKVMPAHLVSRVATKPEA